ncbi:MAG: 4'-phosphopantetheinyl transferase superfamily protein [Pelobacteraceae bacterium]
MKPTPRPRDNEVHLYCLTLSHGLSGLTGYERLLSATEIERAGLLKSDLVKSRFIVGRGILRGILGGYSNIDPADVQIATGEQGKPYRADTDDLRFNLSHVDDLLVIAVAAGVEVGIDVERIAAEKPVFDMARLAFSRQEQEELRAMPASEQIRAFYRCWVRKEACLKACGRGFSLASSSFDVPMNVAEPPTPTLINCNQSFWHVRDIEVPEKYCAAVAVEAGGVSPSPPTIVWVVPKT